MKKLLNTLALILLLSLMNELHGQYNNFTFFDARSKSLGGLSSTLTQSAYSFLWNPANLSFTRQPNFSLNVNESFFYNKAAIADFIPGIGSVGFTVGRIQAPTPIDYAGVGLAKSYASGLRIGFSSMIFDRERSYSPQFNVGMSYFPFRKVGERIFGVPIYWDRIGLAAVIQNMVISKKRFGIPLQANFGVSYVIAPSFFQTFSELQFTKNRRDYIQGIEIKSFKSAVLRTGIANFDSKRWLYGMGVFLGSLQLDIVYERFKEKIQFSANVKFGETPATRAKKNYEQGMNYLDNKEVAKAYFHFRNSIAYQPENKTYQSTFKIVDVRYKSSARKEKKMLRSAIEYERKGEKLLALIQYDNIHDQFPNNEIAKRKVNLLRSSASNELNPVRKRINELLEQSDFVNANRVLSRIHHLFPNDTLISHSKQMTEDTLKYLAEKEFLLGLGYYSQKKYRSALSKFENVKRYDPLYPSIKENLKDVQNRIQNKQSQIDSLVKIASQLETNGNYLEAVNKYGMVLQLDFENQKASQAVHQLKPQFDQHLMDLLKRAQSAYEIQNFRLSESLCSEILNLKKDYLPAKYLIRKIKIERAELAKKFESLGDVAYNHGDDSTALKHYLKAREFNLGNSMYSNAVTRTRLRIDRNRKWSQAKKALAGMQYNKAEELSIQLLAADPGRQEIATFISIVRTAKNRQITILLQRGIKQYSQKQYQAAADTFDELLKLDQTHKTAKEYRRRTLDIITALQNIK